MREVPDSISGRALLLQFVMLPSHVHSLANGGSKLLCSISCLSTIGRLVDDLFVGACFVVFGEKMT